MRPGCCFRPSPAPMSARVTPSSRTARRRAWSPAPPACSTDEPLPSSGSGGRQGPPHSPLRTGPPSSPSGPPSEGPNRDDPATRLPVHPASSSSFAFRRALTRFAFRHQPQPGDQPGLTEVAERPSLLGTDHHRSLFALQDEADHAVLAPVGSLHRTTFTLDPHRSLLPLDAARRYGSDTL